MNLHEECLLKYLLHPRDLTATTEMLKLNNLMIEKSLVCNNNSVKAAEIACLPARI